MSAKLVISPELSLPIEAVTEAIGFTQSPLRDGAHIPQCQDLSGFVKRFWKYVRLDPSTGCWMWTGAATRGYGVLHVSPGVRNRILAHRASYLLFVGELTADLDVCHRCDTPPCCNPGHLFAGTAEDNMKDAAGKGRLNGRRGAFGERQHLAKLTESQVLCIRRRVANGESQRSMTAEYGMSYGSIKNVVARRTWKHLP